MIDVSPGFDLIIRVLTSSHVFSKYESRTNWFLFHFWTSNRTHTYKLSTIFCDLNSIFGYELQPKRNDYTLIRIITVCLLPSLR